MKKHLIILLIMSIFIITTGYNNNKIEKFYLNDKYYNNDSFIDANADDINKLKDKSYIVFTYNNYCNLKIPCNKIFQKFMKENNISMYALPFKEMKKTFIYKSVEYAPSIIIIKNGKIIDYLDAESNKDLKYYQDSKELKKWIEKYVYLENKTE